MVAVILMAVQGTVPVMAKEGGGGGDHGGDHGGGGGDDHGSFGTLTILVVNCPKHAKSVDERGAGDNRTGWVCWKSASDNWVEHCTETDQSISVQAGTPVTLTATAASGFTFDSWRVNNVNGMPANLDFTSTSVTYTLTIPYGTNSETVIATFSS